MKKIIAALVLITAMTTSVFAGESFNELNIEDSEPIKSEIEIHKLQNGELAVPLRHFFEADGYMVLWSIPNQIIIQKPDTEIEIFVGSNTFFKDGEEIEVQTPVYIDGDISYIPISFVDDIFEYSSYEKMKSILMDIDNIKIYGFGDERVLDDKYIRELYTVDSHISCSIYESRLLDVYYIASALYFDFDSDILMPDNLEIYDSAKAYFEPYKEHEFIKNLDHYVNHEYRSVRGGVVYPILTYLISMNEYGVGINNVFTDVFENDFQFYSFLYDLLSFYEDTNAEAFFYNSDVNDIMEEYILAEIGNAKLAELFIEMDHYTGDKSALFGEAKVRYRTVVTMFKPHEAVFYNFFSENNCFFMAQMSPLMKDQENNYTLNLDSFIEKQVNQFLRNYLNGPVYAFDDTKQYSASGYDKSKLGQDMMFQDTQMVKIYDDNIIKAIESAIYANVLDDRERAHLEIIGSHIDFEEMEAFYDWLEEYEENRDIYPSINGYLEIMNEDLFL